MAEQLNLKPAPWVEIVIPTRNSERWIRQLLRRYRMFGINPLYLVDTTSTDRTAHILRAEKARTLQITPKKPRVEAIIPEIRAFTAAPWVLRLDDDEFPSIGLLKVLQGTPPRDDLHSLAIPRRWARLNAAGQLEFGYSTFARDATGAVGDDHQWRLFNPDKVTYTDEIHTPGFIKEKNWEALPACAYMVHFDWVCRTDDERRAKMRAYDAQKPGMGEKFWFMYMPGEVIKRDQYRSISPPDDEFDEITRQVAVGATMSSRAWIERVFRRAIGRG